MQVLILVSEEDTAMHPPNRTAPTTLAIPNSFPTGSSPSLLVSQSIFFLFNVLVQMISLPLEYCVSGQIILGNVARYLLTVGGNGRFWSLHKLSCLPPHIMHTDRPVFIIIIFRRVTVFICFITLFIEVDLKTRSICHKTFNHTRRLKMNI